MVQAKCREAPKADARDAGWLVAQLKREFEKFIKNKSLRRPDYYIIATNVILSPEPTNGGRVRVERLISQYKKKLRFKSASIWSADELRAYLENARDIRLSYAAWLTPSDVLAGLIDHMGKPKLREVLPLALARDLRQERDVRLRDAGQETEKPVYLDDLFVDLPFTAAALSDDGDGEESEEEDQEDEEPTPLELEEAEFSHRVVAQILRRSADKLDSESIACRHYSHKGRSAEPLPNRLVILGGPGQGKSTLGQFLAQVSRARLLAQHLASLLNPQTADIISPVLERARIEGLPLLGPARFPIRVDLPIYADALQKAGSIGLSLIAFMASRLSRNVDQSISATDLREWLKTCPALIILDGLDEVPPSSNRVELIKSIDALWDDLTLVETDVLVVVTTRPQGYNDDLSVRYWQHWELSQLTSSDALNFARRLSEVRLSDPDRREAIMLELSRAASDNSTMLLLTSPLQVTIMFGISLLKGAIPQDRWELFERYYTLLRDREAQKTGPDAKVIRDYKRQIDAIHYQAGFALHVISETAGGANPHLTLLQFRALIVRLFTDEEHSPEDVSSISAELVRIATERLVLLNCRVEGRIAFDVRSLQEYMAAAQIAAFSSNIVIQRLRHIALSAHWQHVFRIAASKIFSVAELGPLRSEVVGICHALDNGDLGEDGRLVRAGARLALELLQDGLAYTAPVFRRSLVRRALGLLDIGPEMLDDRLALQLVTETAKVFQEEIVSRIAQGETPGAKAAWSLLARLLYVDQPFAESIMITNWPEDPNLALSVIDVRHGDWPSNLIGKIKEAQALAGPAASAHFTEAIEYGPPIGDEMIPIEQFSVLPKGIIKRPPLSRGHFFVRDTAERQICRASFISLSQSASFMPSVDLQSRENWANYKALALFLRSPSKASLAQMLRQLAVHGRSGIPSHTFPWVCVSLLKEQDEGATFEALAEEAERGGFGDLSDWRDAEERWLAQGIEPVDFAQWESGRYIDAKIGARGVCYPQTIMGATGTKNNLAGFLPVVRSISAVSKRLRLQEILLLSLRRAQSIPAEIRDELLLGAINTAKEISFPRNSRLLHYLGSVAESWKVGSFLDLANELGSKWTSVDAPIQLVLPAFNKDPWRRGLLSFIDGQGRRLSPREIAKIDQAALSPIASDTRAIRYSVARLRLSSGNWGKDDIDGIVEDLGVGTEEFRASSVLGPIFEAHSSYLSLLRAMCSSTVTSKSIVRGTLRSPLQLLAREVGAQSSGLVEETIRAALELPSIPT